ncbi:hypothetical protein SGLAM104S_10477 [Streptomyces glaucescens]
MALVGFVLAWFLKEDRLRGSVTAPDVTETLASNPVERSSHDEVCRALSVLGTREGRREVYRKITARAGYDLLPAASWLLLRMKRYGWVEPAVLAERTVVPLGVLLEAARQVEERRLGRPRRTRPGPHRARAARSPNDWRTRGRSPWRSCSATGGGRAGRPTTSRNWCGS